MKRIASILLSVVLLLALMIPTAYAAGAYAGKTVILYTGDLRGDVDVYAQVKAAADAYEAGGAEVILVDAGNYLQGSAAANTDRGLGIYQLMDAAGYDVAAMGLAEFGYGDATTGYPYHSNLTKYFTQSELTDGAEASSYKQGYSDTAATIAREAKAAAGFAVVSANVTGESDYYSFVPNKTITTKAGLKVGFYGLTDPSVAKNVQNEFIKGLTFGDADAIAMTGCDVVVCLSNAGIAGDQYGDILIDAPTGAGKVVGAYVIDNAAKTVTKESVTLGAADSTVAALAAEIKAAAGTVVGTSQVILNGADSVGWNQETNLGDLVTDALVWYAKNYIDGIDTSMDIVAIQNGGNCDNFLYTGDITETDLLKALPFSPMGIGVLQVTGAQLLETIEAATQDSDCPGFAQVSGLTYALDASKEYDAGEAFGDWFKTDSINRVTITSVNGKAFDPAARYLLVCDNFLINGNDTYYTLPEIKGGEGAVYVNNGGGVKVRDVVAQYIQRQLGGVIGSAYAKPQGRILKTNFSDVSTSAWYCDEVNWAYDNGLMNGVGTRTFAPESNLTRGQLVTVLYRLEKEPAAAKSPFTDVGTNEYYTKAVNWAAANGIVDGITTTTFAPNAPVSREQMATILYRYSEYKKYSTTDKADLSGYTDASKISSYATDAMKWANAEALITGVTTTVLNPTGTATRAQVATILMRFCENVAK